MHLTAPDIAPRADIAPKAPVPFYLPELDGLRFFAFLAVFITHTVGFGSGGSHHHLPAWLGDLLGAVGTAGNFGVDLFFTLSSFLITSLLLRELETNGRLDIRQFYIRRALRIWPVYFLVTLIALGASFYVAGEKFPPHVLASYLLFVGNWAFVFSPVSTIAAPLWSVSVEEQFYLAWPWLVRRGAGKAIKIVAVMILVVGAIGCIVLQWLAPDVDWVTRNSFTRIDGVAIGALLALRVRSGDIRLAPALRYLLLGVSILVLLWVPYAFELFNRPVGSFGLVLGWFLVAVSCGAILLSVIGCTGFMRYIFTNRISVYLGRISYGLYAFHEIVLRSADNLFPEHSHQPAVFVEYWVFSLVLTLLVASISYRWLETPFLRWKQLRFTVVKSRPD
jgi:peptidoglycan/LPS O-acetylase OafA/YrhL